MTVLVGYAKFIFKILDFYNVKSYTFVKLTNLATISKNIFFLLDIHIYLYVFA